MVTHPLLANVLTLRSELGDSMGRMCVWGAGGRSSIIGSSTVADVLATCPNAMATVLCDGNFVAGFVEVTSGTRVKESSVDAF